MSNMDSRCLGMRHIVSFSESDLIQRDNLWVTESSCPVLRFGPNVRYTVFWEITANFLWDASITTSLKPLGALRS